MGFKNLRTVRQIAEDNPIINEATLRWWIFHAAANGFRSCVVRVGRRIYIDVDRFGEWLESHRDEAPSLPAAR